MYTHKEKLMSFANMGSKNGSDNDSKNDSNNAAGWMIGTL